MSRRLFPPAAGLALLLALLPASQAAAGDPPVVMPQGAPPIASGFRSRIGVNRLPRGYRHQGIDIRGPEGQPVIAAAPGTVLEVATDTCWGPTVVVDHGPGPDGKPLIALYGHVDSVEVRAGQTVRRGQLLARLGNNYRKFRCAAGVRHLHFQLGRRYRSGPKGSYWGNQRFLVDGAHGVNPHLYWADGPGRVTCFRPAARPAPGTLTYPVPCR